MRRADPESVALGWLALQDGFTAGMVGAELPSDNSTWAGSGFVTGPVTGGTPDLYLPLRKPVASLFCWTVNPDTGLPPWGKARQLAEAVRAATFPPQPSTLVTLPYADEDARVMAAYFISEPRRSFGDLGDYACFVVDLQVQYTTVAR